MRSKTKPSWLTYLLMWLTVTDGIDGLINLTSLVVNLIS